MTHCNTVMCVGTKAVDQLMESDQKVPVCPCSPLVIGSCNVIAICKEGQKKDAMPQNDYIACLHPQTASTAGIIYLHGTPVTLGVFTSLVTSLIRTGTKPVGITFGTG